MTMQTQLKIGVIDDAPARKDEAQILAASLALPYADQNPQTYSHLLALCAERIELRSLGKNAPGPIYVDFTAGAARHRRLYGGGRGQPLARALGLKAGATPDVIDTTAGLGRDAFVLATLGCRVRMLERSALIACLLHDGLQRATQDAALSPWLAQRLSLIPGDALAYLNALEQAARPEMIYLDPMYPKRMKSALVKKEMRVFQTLLGHDQDGAALLSAALRAATKRVVVKRPKGAQNLEGPKPTTVIQGKNTRYDVYIKSALA